MRQVGQGLREPVGPLAPVELEEDAPLIPEKVWVPIGRPHVHLELLGQVRGLEEFVRAEAADGPVEALGGGCVLSCRAGGGCLRAPRALAITLEGSRGWRAGPCLRYSVNPGMMRWALL